MPTTITINDLILEFVSEKNVDNDILLNKILPYTNPTDNNLIIDTSLSITIDINSPSNENSSDKELDAIFSQKPKATEENLLSANRDRQNDSPPLENDYNASSYCSYSNLDSLNRNSISSPTALGINSLSSKNSYEQSPFIKSICDSSNIGTRIGAKIGGSLAIISTALGAILGITFLLIKYCFLRLISIRFPDFKCKCVNPLDSDTIMNWLDPIANLSYFAIEVPIKNLTNLGFAGLGFVISPLIYLATKIKEHNDEQFLIKKAKKYNRIFTVQPILPLNNTEPAYPPQPETIVTTQPLHAMPSYYYHPSSP